MKILFYNWVDYNDPEKRGGGVSIYQRNLLAELERRSDVACSFLSSGISYDFFSVAPRWERLRHSGAASGSQRYEIVNSAALAPGHFSFGLHAQVTDARTEEAFFDFLRRTGPYDIVHFNNLEGIPCDVLRLRDRFPESRVVVSLHNYYPICPQVNLWYREHALCTDFRSGRKCVHCLVHRVNASEVRRANAMAFWLKKRGLKPGTKMFDRLFMRMLRVFDRTLRVRSKLSSDARAVYSFPKAPEIEAAPSGLLPSMQNDELTFQWRRERMLDALNRTDAVLCVSDRVSELARRYGVRPDLVQTSYIGSPQSDRFAETEPRPSLVRPDGTVRFAYLGYMRHDKGFFFLLDALESLPPRIAQRVHLVLAAKRADHWTMVRIDRLKRRFASIDYHDGYGHDDLDAILEDVDVGIVPVLWEDNLPQVAIEMHARHIPLLTSNLGGARELGNFPPMVFEAGDINAFHAKVTSILEGHISARSYWRCAMAPVSMPSHAESLLELYRRLTETAPDETEAPNPSEGTAA